jgi:hypothetical protein
MNTATPWASLWATLVQSAAYLLVTASVGLQVKFGLAFLRKGWINLDLLWAIVLMATAFVALVV